MVGTVGCRNMEQVMAVGDSVNIASRIEDVNKEVGAKFLISEATYIQVKKHVRVNRSFPITLRGKSGKHTLYEVIGMGKSDS